MTPFTAELIGTALVILLGDGVVANVLLSKSKGHNAGWVVVTTGWGLEWRWPCIASAITAART